MHFLWELRNKAGRNWKFTSSPRSCIIGTMVKPKDSPKEAGDQAGLEERLAECTIEKVGEGVFWVDSEGRFRRINEAACRMHGFTREELLARDIHDVTDVYAGSRKEWARFWEHLRRERHMLKESQHFRKDGTRFPVEVQAVFVEAEGEEFCCGFAREITERKRREAQLRAAIERWQTVFEASNDAIFIVDPPSDRIVAANARAAAITGYPQEQLKEVPISSIHPREMERLRAFDKEVRECGYGRSEEFSCLAKTGASVPVEISASPIDFEGRERLMVIARDITRRKQAERELREAYEEVKRLKDRLKAENLYLQSEIEDSHAAEGIVTVNPPFKEVLKKARQVARTGSTALILGETGTGKELIARLIHAESPRRDRPLVKINCAALPENLIESELFGHEQGAFTGATSRREGRFELAADGTIFLDEIGELSPELQVKFLRILQEGEFERIGGTKTLRVDVRAVAATNRDLRQAVLDGEFREDLYYRLSVFPLTTVPLRERKDDIPPLVEHFVTKHRARVGSAVKRISKRTYSILQHYDWPGNVRELENVVERALIVSTGIDLEINENLLSHSLRQKKQEDPQTLKEMEKAMIEEALENSGGVIEGKRGAARRLDMPASTLRERMRRFGISRRK